MNQDCTVLRTSHQLLLSRADKLADCFYALLFERHPETALLFTGSAMMDQKTKLTTALSLIVHNIDRPEYLRAYLRGLGARHAAYGVRPEHYPLVTECLLLAFAETAGSTWSRDEESAWRGALAFISDAMLGAVTRA